MNKKFKHFSNAGTWVGVGTAIGAAVLRLQMNQYGSR